MSRQIFLSSGFSISTIVACSIRFPLCHTHTHKCALGFSLFLSLSDLLHESSLANASQSAWRSFSFHFFFVTLQDPSEHPISSPLHKTPSSVICECTRFCRDVPRDWMMQQLTDTSASFATSSDMHLTFSTFVNAQFCWCRSSENDIISCAWREGEIRVAIPDLKTSGSDAMFAVPKSLHPFALG